MSDESNEFDFILHHNEPENNPLLERGIKRLWHEVFPGIGSFQPEHSEKLQEPAQYPTFDYRFIRTFSGQHTASGVVNQSLFYSASSPMTTIRVDPPILQNCSQNIQSSATTLTSVGNNINSSASGAPSYDGQFGPKVRAIAAGASAQAGQLSGAFSSLAGWLSNKAQQFINADGGSAAVLGASTSRLAWIPHYSIVDIASGIFRSIINRLFPKGLPWSHLPGNRLPVNSTVSLNSVYKATTTTGLNLRSNFGLGSTVLGVLPAGASLQVLDGKMEKDGYTWVRVRTADGQVGWVAEKYLSIGKDSIIDDKNNSNEGKKTTNNLAIGLRQSDERWAGIEMGIGTGGTIKEYGCLITTITMIGRFYGADVTPVDMNNWLRQNNGYSKGSSGLIWNEATNFLNTTLGKQGNLSKMDIKSVNSLLQTGIPVILHIPGPTEDGHYVLGIEVNEGSNTITVLDPWNNGEKEINYSKIKRAWAYSTK